jgi:hypothetical protein
MTIETGRSSTNFNGIEVIADKAGAVWRVEAEGRSPAEETLDQALRVVLPQLSYQDHDRLLVRLLLAVTTSSPQDR